MTSITSSIKKELYKVNIQTASGNMMIADEPEQLGGKDKGFSPTELLAASLAACTSATLRMYADRKGWDLTEVKLDISLARNIEANTTTLIRKITLLGNLEETQKERLMEIANKCPIHKILTNPISIQTEMM